MGALGEKERVREVIAMLECIELGRPDALPTVVPAIREITGAYSAAGYRVNASCGSLEVEGPPPSFADHRSPAEHWRRFRSYVRTSQHQWGGYDPRCPEPAQRNRVIVIDDPVKIMQGAAPVPRNVSPLLVPALELHLGLLSTLGWARPHARVLLCDGARLLAYVGIVDDVLPTRRQQALLRSLVPALHRRMIAEDRLRSGDVLRSAIDAALAHIGAPAFVLDQNGFIAASNQAAQGWYDRDRDEVLEVLCTRPPELEITPFSDEGLRGSLCVYRGSAPGQDPRVAAAVARWGLTPRQAEVLALLARGHTNARIAAELGCVEGTVEIHVSRIFSRAQVANRAALIAELLWNNTSS